MTKTQYIDKVLRAVGKKRIQLCIGCTSGFWFIGSAAEFKRDLPLLEWYYVRKYEAYLEGLRKRTVSKTERMKLVNDRTAFMTRQVVKIYKRHIPDELPQLAVIVFGKDAGECVFAEEYKKKLPHYFTEYWNDMLNGLAPADLFSSLPDAWQHCPEIPSRRPVKAPETCDDNWLDFANAILQNAAEDYKAAYKTERKKRPDGPVQDLYLGYEAEQIEDFFNSDWAKYLAGNASPTRFAAKIREIAEEELLEEQRQKNGQKPDPKPKKSAGISLSDLEEMERIYGDGSGGGEDGYTAEGG